MTREQGRMQALGLEKGNAELTALKSLASLGNDDIQHLNFLNQEFMIEREIHKTMES